MKPATISAPQLGKMLGVHKTTVYRWLSEGRIREVKIGGRRLVPTEEAERIVSRPFQPEWIGQ